MLVPEQQGVESRHCVLSLTRGGPDDQTLFAGQRELCQGFFQ